MKCDFCNEDRPVRRAIGGVICERCWTDPFPFEKLPPYREELTPAGPQLVIPGCETRDRPKTAQLSLWP